MCTGIHDGSITVHHKQRSGPQWVLKDRDQRSLVRLSQITRRWLLDTYPSSTHPSSTHPSSTHPSLFRFHGIWKQSEWTAWPIMALLLGFWRNIIVWCRPMSFCFLQTYRKNRVGRIYAIWRNEHKFSARISAGWWWWWFWNGVGCHHAPQVIPADAPKYVIDRWRCMTICNHSWTP